jgi:hypothetical protein
VAASLAGQADERDHLVERPALGALEVPEAIHGADLLVGDGQLVGEGLDEGAHDAALVGVAQGDPAARGVGEVTQQVLHERGVGPS